MSSNSPSVDSSFGQRRTWVGKLFCVSDFPRSKKKIARLGLIPPTKGFVSLFAFLSLLAAVSHPQANPFEKPNPGQAIRLESVIVQTNAMNECTQIDASVMLDLDCSERR